MLALYSSSWSVSSCFSCSLFLHFSFRSDNSVWASVNCTKQTSFHFNKTTLTFHLSVHLLNNWIYFLTGLVEFIFVKTANHGELRPPKGLFHSLMKQQWLGRTLSVFSSNLQWHSCVCVTKYKYGLFLFSQLVPAERIQRCWWQQAAPPLNWRWF